MLFYHQTETAPIGGGPIGEPAPPPAPPPADSPTSAPIHGRQGMGR